MTQTEILQKLKRNLEVRGRSTETVEEYTKKVKLFQDYYEKPADQMGENEIINYLHYLAKGKGVTASTVNTYNSALRFLYGVTLDTALNYKKLPRMKQKRKLPQLYTKDEVCRIIDSAKTLIHRVMLMLAYGSGLRLSEIINLKATDIESAQMRIFVRSGKGDRDRYALLPQATLTFNRKFYKDSTKEYYRCGRYTNKGRTACQPHTILESEIYNAVITDIRAFAKLAFDDEQQLVARIAKDNATHSEQMIQRQENLLAKKECRLTEIDLLVQSLFEDRVSGTVPENIFKRMAKKYDDEQLTLADEIDALINELAT